MGKSQTQENKTIESGITFKDILNGELFARSDFFKHWRYMLFLVFLAMIYIDNHYAVEKLLKEQVYINQELKELKYEAITTSSQLMQMSRQSAVLKKVDEAGVELRVLKTPPRILKVEK